jgi:hypothetical protein
VRQATGDRAECWALGHEGRGETQRVRLEPLARQRLFGAGCPRPQAMEEAWLHNGPVRRWGATEGGGQACHGILAVAEQQQRVSRLEGG